MNFRSIADRMFILLFKKIYIDVIYQIYTKRINIKLIFNNAAEFQLRMMISEIVCEDVYLKT